MAERAIYSRDSRTDLGRCGCLYHWCWPRRRAAGLCAGIHLKQLDKEKGKEFWVIILEKGGEVGASKCVTVRVRVGAGRCTTAIEKGTMYRLAQVGKDVKM